ncbi:MAG TPA: caspase family protein [Saprospiraceae bacterium]|nr:caspase family protein [Saprospiraceae bacterium]
MKKPTFYAVYVGINAYDNCRQLNGCINDVVAMHRYFARLCAQQPIAYQPKFLLLPHREEKRLLKKEDMDYTKPTRENVINAFDFFAQADPESGDYCLFYYSGHGSYVDAPPIFRPVAPDGTLQTLVCADSRSKKGRDLLDKEIAYLIAKTLEGKTDLKEGKGVHFLSIFDSCHSGTVSRGDDEVVARMEQKGKAISRTSQVLGFTREGNAFYKPFDKGQKAISKDGLKHGRYINLSACRDAEVAQERILDSYIETESATKRNHGVFSFSFLRTLERSGTDLSYGELMRRVQMEIRTRVGNQIPVLGKTYLEDDDLFFLKNRLKAPAKTYEVGCRETRMGWEWYLNAGALNGLLPSTSDQASQIKLTDGSERIVDITFVKGMECILDEKAFIAADREKNLAAVIHQMPFQQTALAYDAQLSTEDQKMFDQEFSKKDLKYIRKAAAGESATYTIKETKRSDQKAFMLARQGSDMPVFLPVVRHANFLNDAEQVGKWENTLLLKNQETQIPRSDIAVSYQKLEGFSMFEPAIFQRLQNYDYSLQFRKEQFSEPVLNPDLIHLNYKKDKDQYIAPALSVSLKNISGFQDYWVGTLYLDSAFGITSKNLEVQELKAQADDPLDLEFRDDRQGIRLPFIPIFFDPYYHEHGLTEITDYLIVVVSKKPFSLDDFEQTSLPLSDRRAQGLFMPQMKEDDWFTIKIPIHISYPLEQVQLKPGETQALTRTFRQHNYQAAPSTNSLSIEAPEGFGAVVNATTSARAKRAVEELSSGRSTVNQRALVPPGSLFQGAEGKTGVFSNSLDVEPDQQLSILELTEVKGTLNPEKPLKIYPGSPLEEDETILPYGYDEEQDIYFPLGYTDGEGTVIIEQLPQPSDAFIGSDAVDEPLDSNDRSIKRSIKLFFNKLVWSKLTGHHEYQTLGLVKTGKENEERLVYHGTGSGEDRAALSQMQNYIQEQSQQKGKSGILLLIHGIIGNTDAQVKAVFEHTDIHQEYAAVFTFDYENLNTPIDKTAQHLAKCLTDLGLKDNQLTIIAHSMGGLVSRYMIEQAGMAKVVRRLVQAGTPNAGSELSDFRKKITGWIGMGINGVAFIQPYLTILSFIGKGLEKRIFKTLDQMGPGSSFLTRLNAGSAQQVDQLEYALIAGDTNLIKAPLLKKDPMWKKLLKALKKRGAYLFLDYLVFDDTPNDMAVKVESMKVLPDPNARIEIIDCNHMMYFSDADSLKLLKELTT